MASELLVNKITPESGNTLTLGESGDTISFASGVLPSLESLTITGDLTVDTNTLFVDSTNNRVGIGTGSPTSNLMVIGDTNLTLSGAGTKEILKLNNSNTDAGTQAIKLSFNSSGVTKGSIISAVYGDGYMAFQTNNDTEKMRISASGNVGIGTSSPSAKLEVFGADDANNLIVGYNNTDFAVYTDGTVGEIRLKAEDGSGSNFSKFMTFYTHPSGSVASERMRIDSSGNLLVGKTGTSNGTNGFALIPNGASNIVRDGGACMQFNRKTSDGKILEFLKDTSSVGSIGVANNDNLTISGNSTHAGLNFGTATLVAYKNGSFADNQIDLGSSLTRFKDIYLSGGLRVGGTGSANALDDYEEGDWTPGFTFGGSSAGIVYTVRAGKYVKIGRKVTCILDIRLSSNGSGAGAALLTGLPFTVGNDLPQTSLEGGGLFTYHTGQGTSHSSLSIIPDDDSTTAQMYANLITQATNAYISNTSTMRGVFVYFTDS